MQELTEEQKRDNPSVSKVKRLMKSTFTGRRSWIQKDTPSVSDIIDVFPALKQSNRVSIAFCYDFYSSSIHV